MNLKLGQVVIKRVAVVELGVNNGSGNGGSCFGIEVWTDTANDTRCYFNVRSKADISQLNLPHGTDN